MNDSIFFYVFLILSIPFIILNFIVLIVLKKKGYVFSFFNMDLSNYASLKKLAYNEKKYYYLYIAYLGFTILPALLFLFFIMHIFS